MNEPERRTGCAAERARALLRDVTPLRSDCGTICGAACCQSMPGEESGMLLFPGEEALPMPEGARVVPSALEVRGRAVPLLVCNGTCDREKRPLACRIFPLVPEMRRGGLRIVRDVRAWPVCPLMSSGMRGMDPAFVRAVEEAMACFGPEDADYFEALTALLRSYRTLA